jgi:hypothetical protein
LRKTFVVHDRFEYEMPAPAGIVFDAFHYHQWRHEWDSLVNATHVLGGAACPYVGAMTENSGGGFLKPLAMRTRFISYQPGKIAAARMEGRAFPFARWAASMRHLPGPGPNSLMVYTYSFECAPRPLRWLLEPITKLVFDWQTHKRFHRMRCFLENRSVEVGEWQRTGRQP